MDLRRLTPADITQVRQVWKECFGDSDSFLDAYFAACVSVSDGLGFFDGGRLVSDMFTYRINTNISGMVYQSQFIAGCATLPQARNQHLMRDLIRSALTDMASRNVCLCFLHPFLHSFYRKFGFETVAYVDRLEADGEPPAGGPAVKVANSMADLPFDSVYASYAAYVTQFGSYFIRNRDRMQAWLELLFSDGGRAVYIDGSNATPYALYYPAKDGQTNEVFELVYFRPEQLSALVNSTGAPAQYFLPSGPDAERSAQEFTMMRVLNPQIMLASYQYQAGTKPFVINIHDEFLGRDDNLQVTPQASGAQVDQTEQPADVVVDVTDLARLFTGEFSPKSFPAATPYFTQNSSCYFETY